MLTTSPLSLFIELVHALMLRYRGKRKVHLVLDNYSIHKSELTRPALERYEGRLELHFLPPFCPDENLAPSIHSPSTNILTANLHLA
jgi:transposase